MKSKRRRRQPSVWFSNPRWMLHHVLGIVPDCAFPKLSACVEPMGFLPKSRGGSRRDLSELTKVSEGNREKYCGRYGRLATNPNRSKSRIFNSRNGPIWSGSFAANSSGSGLSKIAKPIFLQSPCWACVQIVSSALTQIPLFSHTTPFSASFAFDSP
jgi:hypothetical protein